MGCSMRGMVPRWPKQIPTPACVACCPIQKDCLMSMTRDDSSALLEWLQHVAQD